MQPTAGGRFMQNGLMKMSCADAALQQALYRLSEESREVVKGGRLWPHVCAHCFLMQSIIRCRASCVLLQWVPAGSRPRVQVIICFRTLAYPRLQGVKVVKLCAHVRHCILNRLLRGHVPDQLPGD